MRSRNLPTWRKAWTRLTLPGLALASVALASACAGGGGATTSGGGGVVAPESVWNALNQPRPTPLPGATRITVSNLMILHDPWGLQGAVTTSIGIEELVAAGLLRRSDVNFVERRRFSEAAERERRGLPAPPGAPPVGVSPGAEYVLTGTWAASGPDSAALDLRLTHAETGDVAEAWRAMTPRDADPVAVARVISGSLLQALERMQRLPNWVDPNPSAAPVTYRSAPVSLSAITSFFAGVAAEERYRWEEARAAYQAALDSGGAEFFEPEVALARIARLRAGGTLGASDR